MKIEINSLNQMKEFAQVISGKMQIGDVFGLEGDLGAGKTTLISLILESLDYPEAVSSPTFSLVNIYESQPRINHLDLYRLEVEEEIESFEYEEYFYPENSISFIEWPSMARSYLPRKIYYIKFSLVDDQKRLIEIDDEFIERND